MAGAKKPFREMHPYEARRPGDKYAHCIPSWFAPPSA